MIEMKPDKFSILLEILHTQSILEKNSNTQK